MSDSAHTPDDPGRPAPDKQAGASVAGPASPPADRPQAMGPFRPQRRPAFSAPPPPPAPPRRGAFRHGFGLGAGAGLGFGGVVLALSLIGSLLAALTMMGAATAFAGVDQTRLEPTRTIWGRDSAGSELRAISVSGPIMADASDGSALVSGTFGYETAQVIDNLRAEDADGLVLLMNTPGGSVNGSRAIADAVERYQARTGKKAVAYVQGMSASGGVYTMAGVDRIVADHGSLVGSIGIIMGPFDQYRDVKATTGSLLESGISTDGGITTEYLTQGKGKDFGNPFRPMGVEERQNYLTGLANEYDDFVNWVSKHRGIPAATIKNTLGAYMFDNERAQQHKLIDATMGPDEAFRDFATFAGLDPNDTRVVAAEPPSMWAQVFGVQNRVYGQAPAAQPEGGQPARATASLCERDTFRALRGDLATVCG